MSTPTPPNAQPPWQPPRTSPGQDGQPGLQQPQQAFQGAQQPYQGPQQPQQPYQGPQQPQHPYQGPQQPQQPYQGPHGPQHTGQQFGPQYGQPPMTHAQARAQARGAAAQAKAMRPWFKKKRFILPLAVVALFVIVGIGTAGGNNGTVATAGTPASSAADPQAADPTEEPTSEPAKKAKPKSAGIGDTVKAGDWSFKVTSFDCGKTKVGNQYAGKKAQGHFCFLKITAKNNGDSEGTLNGDSQKLSDDDGKEYSSDLEASLYEDADSMLFLEGVNPGNTAKGTIIFDVPKEAKITEVTLTGGLFSDSADVSLR